MSLERACHPDGHGGISLILFSHVWIAKSCLVRFYSGNIGALIEDQGNNAASPAGTVAVRRGGLRTHDASVPDLLRLLGAGPTGSILMVLGKGPLRTKQLTERVPGCTPRTVYRHAGRLTEMGLVEKNEGPGVPSTVVYRLAEPSGRALFRLLDASLPRLSDGQLDDRSWAFLGLLAELWESGLVDELSREARSPTELATGSNGLTFHQINRRAQLFKARGLLCDSNGRGRSRRYQLADQGRQAISLVAGIARWRQRYVETESEAGLTAPELATVLRAVLPLVRLPGYAGTSVRLGVAEPVEGSRAMTAETLLMSVDDDGATRCCEDDQGPADGWALATINTWFAAILDGNRGRIRVGGDLKLIDSCLTGLYTALWMNAIP